MDIHIQMLCVLCCEKVSFIHHRRNTEVRTLPLALLQFVRVRRTTIDEETS